MKATSLNEVFQGLGPEIANHLLSFPGPLCEKCGSETNKQNFFPVYAEDGGLAAYYLLYFLRREPVGVRVLPVEFTPSLVLSDPSGFRDWLLLRLGELEHRGKIVDHNGNWGRAVKQDTFSASNPGSCDQTGIPVNAGRL